MIENTYIFCFQSQKGGVGKTTLACHFARALIWNGKPVILIDTDPQASAQDWSAARETESPFPIVGYARDKLHKDIRQIVTGYKYAVIDSPPRTTNVARSALLCSDSLIIPVSPSALDLWALSDTIQLAEEAKQYNESLKMGIVINREIAKTQISRAVEKELQKTGLHVFENHIKQRVLFAEVMGSGRTVMEVDPEGEASREFFSFWSEVLDWAGKVIWVPVEEWNEVYEKLVKKGKKAVEEDLQQEIKNRERVKKELDVMKRRLKNFIGAKGYRWKDGVLKEMDHEGST
jgi:chromosome partitioning protein